MYLQFIVKFVSSVLLRIQNDSLQIKEYWPSNILELVKKSKSLQLILR